MNNDELRRLHAARQQAWNEISEISDTAAAEGRDFTAEEEGFWVKGNAHLASLDERISVVLDHEKRNADIEAALGRYGTPEAPAAPPALSIEDELRALGRGELRSVVVPAERRDLTKGSSTAGGDTVPTSFYGQVWEHMIESSAILQAGATVLNTAAGENLEIPVTTAHSSGALISEGGNLTESDPAFVKRTLGAYKYGLAIQASSELVADTGFDLLGYLARQAGRAVGNAMGVHMITGSGSSQPSGIVTGASTGVTGSASVSGAFTADNLIDLYFAVIAPYRNSSSCAWIMKDATLGAVRKLKDSQNQYLWQPSLIVGQPDTLLGKPVFTDPNVAAVALSAKSVIFGDISAYYARIAGGIRFERSDDFAFGTDLVTFRAIVRGDGTLADRTGAVKLFVGNAA